MKIEAMGRNEYALHNREPREAIGRGKVCAASDAAKMRGHWIKINIEVKK